MKTSNKLLIGAFIFLLVSVMAFLITGRIVLDQNMKGAVSDQLSDGTSSARVEYVMSDLES